MWVAITQWWRNSWIALDMFVNAVVFFGYPGETISSRLGRKSPTCKFCRGVCSVLNIVFRQANHCKAAEQSEQDEDYIPPELRKP